ncbi:hypothetical protein OAQ99_04370 [Candidatus Kapabacteria bacterium]|nr:hypothetical protein [Candidatus Kapabacteria bacterium]
MQANKVILNLSIFLIALFLISSISRCGSSSNDNNTNAINIVGPADSLLKVYKNKNNLTIILSDMDYIESNDLYQHKYHIVYTETKNSSNNSKVDSTNDDPLLTQGQTSNKTSAMVDSTDWIKVDVAYFDKHINDLGMEIASIDNGSIRKASAPAGYTNYVGNENYGSWDNSNNWMFYPRYSFFNAWLMYSIMPIRYSYWDTYRTGYYRTGSSYYGTGTNGGRMYGSGSNVSNNYKNKNWTNKSPSSKRSIRSKAQRTTAKKTSFGGRRSSSRYGSSARSRGSSFGK